MLSLPSLIFNLSNQKDSYASLVFFLMLLLFNLTYGFQYKVPVDYFYFYFLTATLIFFSILLFLVKISVFNKEHDSHDLPSPIVFCLIVFSLALTLYLSSKALPINTWAAELILLLAAIIMASFLGWEKASLWLAAFGLLIMVYIGISTPNDVKAANMLPVIQAACQDLAVGINPYGKLYPSISSSYMYYLPGVVLPYCPLEINNMDLRWLNVICYLAFGVTALWMAAYTKNNNIIITTSLLLLPMTANLIAYCHEWLYWITVVVGVMGVLTGYGAVAGLAVGAALGMRQHSIFLALPLVFVYWRLWGARRALSAGFIAIIMFAIAIYLSDLSLTQFFKTFYSGVATQAAEVNIRGGNPFDQIALSALLLELIGRTGLMLLQLLTIAVTSALVWRHALERSKCLIMLGVGYCLTIGLNSFLSRYLYIPGFLLIAIGLMTSIPVTDLYGAMKKSR